MHQSAHFGLGPMARGLSHFQGRWQKSENCEYLKIGASLGKIPCRPKSCIMARGTTFVQIIRPNSMTLWRYWQFCGSLGPFWPTGFQGDLTGFLSLRAWDAIFLMKDFQAKGTSLRPFIFMCFCPVGAHLPTTPPPIFVHFCFLSIGEPVGEPVVGVWGPGVYYGA